MVQKNRFVNPQLKWRCKKSKNAFFIIPLIPDRSPGQAPESNTFMFGELRDILDELIYPIIYVIR